MPPLITFSGCQPCSLRKEWPWLRHPQMPVATPTEPSEYRVMAIGEAPGETEDTQGIPFVGTTGKLLRENIPTQWKNKLYWSNTVRCRPPKNRKPIEQEIQCCSLYQERDLDIIKPQAILVLGDYALKYFWPTAWVTGMRGIPFPIELPDKSTTWCYGSFHPSYVAHSERKDYDTGEKVNTVLPVFRNDLRRFFEQVPYFAANPPTIQHPPKKEFLYPKTEQEVLNLFDRLKDPYAVDLETFKLKPYMRDARIITAGFSDGDITFAFPVRWPGGFSDWGLRAFNTIMRKDKTWIAQHANFEYSWIWDSTKKHDQKFHDIEVLARLIHKRKGLGSLDDLSRIYLGVDIKKLTDVDKNRLLDYPQEKVLEYNAIDAWAEYLIYWILMEKAIEDQNIVDNYFRIINACKSTVGMELHGLPVSLEESAARQKELLVKMREMEVQSRQIQEVREFEHEEKKIFQISSPEVVGHVLVSYCGIQLPKTEGSEKKGKDQYSTSEDDLAPLLGKHPLVDLTLDFREVQKLLSTYIEPILSGEVLGADGMLHPSYTTVRTATYRLSAELPNIQNFPKRKNRQIRRQVIAPPGHLMAAFDYGQLEARVLCMYSRDPVLSYIMAEQAKAIVKGDEATVKKLDIHWKWLYRILEVYPQYMDRLRNVSGEKTEKGILKAGRTIIKTDFVFASFYGSVARSLSNRTQIPLNITNQILEEFWTEYAKVKEWINQQFEYYNKNGEVKSGTGRIRNENLPGNEVINTPVQGLAAELVLEAQNALFFRSLQEDLYLMPRINIHDDLVFILPEDNEDRTEQYIKEIGKEIVKARFPFVNVPLMTECRVGKNFCDLESITNFVGEYNA